MNNNRYIKWSNEALDFFELSEDNSLEPIFMVSHANQSQTFEGFEEFVNSINCENIKKKIKKLHILDAAFLYRHCIPEFIRLSDVSIPSIWLLNNRNAIRRIECDFVIDYWQEQIDNDTFRHWHKQITTNFSGDENGNGIIPAFRYAIETEVALFVSKNRGSATNCLNFLLEEYAHTCAFMKNAIIIYPVPFSSTMQFVISHYNLNISHLQYNFSNKTKRLKKITYDHNAIIREMISLLVSKLLRINIFVVDRRGKYIYKNDTFCELVKESPYVTDPVAWGVSLDVMKKEERVVVEEEYCGTYYMSIKAPLKVNGEIEGVIGISVDITNEKKAEKLELQNDIQQEMKNFTEQVAHDIRSPLAVLSMFAKICDNLSEKDRLTLQSVVGSINDIANGLLNKYKECDDKVSIIEEKNQNILVDLALREVINHKINQYSQSSVSFSYVPDSIHKHTFIRGNFSNFSRMMSNLINNAVEASQNKEIDGKVTINFLLENRYIKIGVLDNGVGMSPEIVERIMNNIPVDSTKESGYGIGLKQITGALQELGGTMCINSTENVGTSIVLTIPIIEPPIWFVDRLMLREGTMIVVLDDDLSVHYVWGKIFRNYSDKLSIKYFEQGQETIDFINSFGKKDDIFLLSDYELRDHGLNGIDVIKKTSMEKQSIIVTNGYNQNNIQNFSEKSGVKILPKPYISDVIIVEVSL